MARFLTLFNLHRHHVVPCWLQSNVFAEIHAEHSRFLATKAQRQKPVFAHEPDWTDDASRQFPLAIAVLHFHDIVVVGDHRLANHS